MIHSSVLFDKIRAVRITTSSRGSWQWQDAYRLSDYVARASNDGRALYKSIWRSRKYSKPQLRGMTCGHGSLHNRIVPRSHALRAIGVSRVRSLEGRGFIFGEG